MREIKFKHYIKTKKGYKRCSFDLSKYQNSSLNDVFYNLEKVENIITVQYTGLKDKNGKEIYEGDIVEYKTKFYDRLKEHKTIIKWEDDLEHNGFGEPFAMGYIFRGFDIEIIGNIYENPELIKRVEK